MNLDILISQIQQLWFLIPLAIAALVFKSAWFKGVMGEFVVNFMLKVSLPKQHYQIINNVTIPTQDGTTQIDHIVVSQYGIFVIETKNMRGWIFGSEKQAMWTQKIFKHSSRFQNPLRQNYKHTKSLEQSLGINPQFIFSVIVFIGQSQFKTAMPPNVTYANGCVKYIKSHSSELLTKEQVATIVEQIQEGRLSAGFATNRAHVQHVKAIVAAKEAAKSSGNPPVAKGTEKSCPRCNAKMILRKSKKEGQAAKQFWGCSTFPKCRAIANAE